MNVDNSFEKFYRKVQAETCLLKRDCILKYGETVSGFMLMGYDAGERRKNF